MAKRLVVCDLDGTLLDKADKLSTKYAIRLNKLIEQGLDFTIATGRDFDNTIIAMKDVQFRNPIILTNGALLARFPSGKVESYLTIEKRDSLEILELSQQMNLNVMVFASYIPELNQARFIKGDWWNPHKLRPLIREQYQDFYDEPFISIQFCDDKEKLDPFYKMADERYGSSMHILYFEDAFLPGKYWLEFNPKTAKKEVMLERLLETTSYTKDHLIVFGDQFNDIGILRMADIACVVANAPDDVKLLADFVIKRNTEGGVVDFLEQNPELWK